MCELCGIDLFSIERVLGKAKSMPPNNTDNTVVTGASESNMSNSKQQHTAPFGAAPANRVKRLKSSEGMSRSIQFRNIS